MPENIGDSHHDLIMESRKKVTMTGIVDVGSFDDETVQAESRCGEITINGSELKISRLSVETGDMTVEGNINSVVYNEGRPSGSLITRIFK